MTNQIYEWEGNQYELIGISEEDCGYRTSCSLCCFEKGKCRPFLTNKMGGECQVYHYFKLISKAVIPIQRIRRIRL